jgi:hypothetical protein
MTEILEERGINFQCDNKPYIWDPIPDPDSANLHWGEKITGPEYRSGTMHYCIL